MHNKLFTRLLRTNRGCMRRMNGNRLVDNPAQQSLKHEVQMASPVGVSALKLDPQPNPVNMLLCRYLLIVALWRLSPASLQLIMYCPIDFYIGHPSPKVAYCRLTAPCIPLSHFVGPSVLRASALQGGPGWMKGWSQLCHLCEACGHCRKCK